MKTLYKWALWFLAFSYGMGWCAANNTGDVQIFFFSFCIIGLAATVILTMIEYLKGT